MLGVCQDYAGLSEVHDGTHPTGGDGVESRLLATGLYMYKLLYIYIYIYIRRPLVGQQACVIVLVLFPPPIVLPFGFSMRSPIRPYPVGISPP